MVKKLLLVEFVEVLLSYLLLSSSPPLEMSLLAEDCPGDLLKKCENRKPFAG